MSDAPVSPDPTPRPASPRDSDSVPRLNLEQMLAVNDELAALLKSGIPLDVGLDELDASPTEAVSEISRAMSARMRTGVSLREALQSLGGRLPRAYALLIEAGIEAGAPAAALEQASLMGREMLRFRQRLSRMLIYPFMLCVLGYIEFVLLIEIVLVRFEFARRSLRLRGVGPIDWLWPLHEHLAYWCWIPPVLLASGLIWWRAIDSARFLHFDGPALPLNWLPGVRSIRRLFSNALLADMLGSLLTRQVPLPKALVLASGVSGSPELAQAGSEWSEQIARGQSPRQAPAAIPPFLAWSIGQVAQGDSSPSALFVLAESYRRKAADVMDWLDLFIPIVMVLSIGATITLLVALTVFGPLSQLWFELQIE